MKKIIIELLALVLVLNDKTDDDYFLDYSGHTNQLDIMVHEGGWRDGVFGKKLLNCCYLEDEASAVKELERVRDVLRQKLREV